MAGTDLVRRERQIHRLDLNWLRDLLPRNLYFASRDCAVQSRLVSRATRLDISINSSVDGCARPKRNAKCGCQAGRFCDGNVARLYVQIHLRRCRPGIYGSMNGKRGLSQLQCPLSYCEQIIFQVIAEIVVGRNWVAHVYSMNPSILNVHLATGGQLP